MFHIGKREPMQGICIVSRDFGILNIGTLKQCRHLANVSCWVTWKNAGALLCKCGYRKVSYWDKWNNAGVVCLDYGCFFIRHVGRAGSPGPVLPCHAYRLQKKGQRFPMIINHVYHLQNTTGGPLLCKQDGVYVVTGISSRSWMGGYYGGAAQAALHPGDYQVSRIKYHASSYVDLFIRPQLEEEPTGSQVACTEFTSVFMNVSLYEAWITRYGMYSIHIMCYSCLYRDIVLIPYL